ncbi:MAG: hypothetical protein ACJ8BW_32330 [Ktedonobacteraceae bacterium]
MKQTAYYISVIIRAYTDDRRNDLISAKGSVQQRTLPASEIIIVTESEF